MVNTPLTTAWFPSYSFRHWREKTLLFDMRKPRLLRYYFCWLSLCYSAAWWLSTRQCIIYHMRAIITRTVWMALYNVAVQTWWEGQLGGDFSEWLTGWKHFCTCAGEKVDTFLDIHEAPMAAKRSGRRGTNKLLVLTEDGIHEQHFSSVHVRRELGVVHFSPLCLFVTLDEDLANADGAAAVPESLLHGLT